MTPEQERVEREAFEKAMKLRRSGIRSRYPGHSEDQVNDHWQGWLARAQLQPVLSKSDEEAAKDYAACCELSDDDDVPCDDLDSADREWWKGKSFLEVLWATDNMQAHAEDAFMAGCAHKEAQIWAADQRVAGMRESMDRLAESANAEITRLKAELAAEMAVVDWYADPGNWCDHDMLGVPSGTRGGDQGMVFIPRDGRGTYDWVAGGEIARARQAERGKE